MKAAQISDAALRANVNESTLCIALDAVLPVLRVLRSDVGWGKFWVKLGLSVAIGALEDFQDEHCGDD